MRALVSTCVLAAFVAVVPATAQADLQVECPAAEYVYAGARMLAVVKEPRLGKAGFVSGLSSFSEDQGTVGIAVAIPPGSSISNEIVLNYAFTGSVAFPGKDFVNQAGTITTTSRS